MAPRVEYRDRTAWAMECIRSPWSVPGSLPTYNHYNVHIAIDRAGAGGFKLNISMRGCARCAGSGLDDVMVRKHDHSSIALVSLNVRQAIAPSTSPIELDLHMSSAYFAR